ncbi:MAG TPA: NUDIX domain-containing protein [Anaerolineales bacterium]|nr:NUDIX domain-containing protein [Anaerolineales bacterium]
MSSKSQLLENLKSKRHRWDMMLNVINMARMDESGAAGHWSVKDIVSHITAYERWLVEWLTAALQNTFPSPSPLDDADIERRNARIYELTRSLSVEQVLADARQTFDALLAVIEALPGKYFDDPQSAEWFMKPYWSKMKTVPDAVINLSSDHYEEHIPSIKEWIKKNGIVLHRDIRYQAAIVQDHYVLLAQMSTPEGKVFWLPPGGGREGNETPEECILREVQEETGLTVSVGRLLFTTPDMPGGTYDFLHTYLCQPISGTAAAGIEPETEFMPVLLIQDLDWFDLRDPSAWRSKDELGVITFPWLERLRDELGYG